VDTKEPLLPVQPPHLPNILTLLNAHTKRIAVRFLLATAHTGLEEKSQAMQWHSRFLASLMMSYPAHWRPVSLWR